MGFLDTFLGKKEKKPVNPVLPQDIYAAGVLELQDVVAPSALSITPRELNLGDQIARTFFVISYPRFLGESWFSPIINLDNPFIKTSITPKVLDIINSYIGVCSKLIYFEIAITNLLEEGKAPMGSQRWHRDPGMKRMVKMFIYLTDVDEKSGPFTYILQSHAGGKWRNLYRQKQFGRRGIYPPEGAVEKAVRKFMSFRESEKSIEFEYRNQLSLSKV